MKVTDALREQGFVIIPGVINSDLAKACAFKVNAMINYSAQDINCSTSDYLAHVCNWQSPSHVVQSIERDIITNITSTIRQHIHPMAHSIRTNIFCRTKYSTQSIPCHQDISYFPEDDYALSSWVALNDVFVDSGALEVLPQSHMGAIESPVDFIDPSYTDTMRNSITWKRHAISLPINTGDMIVFDSRLWHGSGVNSKKLDRYAIVHRWKIPNQGFEITLQPQVKSEFNMWNWIEVSDRIIINSLYNLYHKKSQYLLDGIDCLTQSLLDDNTHIFADTKTMVRTLRSIKICYLANIKHNARDARGTVYRSIWHKLLKHLKNYA